MKKDIRELLKNQENKQGTNHEEVSDRRTFITKKYHWIEKGFAEEQNRSKQFEEKFAEKNPPKKIPKIPREISNYGI